MMKVIVAAMVVGLVGCTSPYESGLTEEKNWQGLGAYHGEQGYRELNEQRLGDLGALSETEYEEYRAGYLKGRFDYCSGRQSVSTVVNADYLNECTSDSSSYGLTGRGY
ncbi:DUF2799 domain-containing protein [Photobacterium sanguinicancri]|uniref:DUF2799 domain-containing protein n=1 Tax=Photobacterium sanguinicancri TaxID=875932 RepID=A0AAW7YAP0_9GAMM|nr:DUF2799 domain-containing protein [Photobacterium sanguinicancri]KXI23671.1 hypothetical protein AS132_06330 [Photobacterium sanguinicancri]MDO6500327.1 DUF2799 domain-containing protein [Photobacterium sanguinicancri]MDO6545060.1 DUF2799 domain-containing protein [Photobacterium sanguinicancri]OZS43282.1 DUF2799 domain-containing protein [Photobacterium sanguinicancri]